MTRKTILTTLSVLALGGVVAATTLPAMASGAKGGQMGAKMMQRFDTDNDGKITRDEFMAPMQDRFAAADADGDGALTVEELAAARLMGKRGDHEGREHMGRGHGHGDRDDDHHGGMFKRGQAEMTPEQRADRAQRMLDMMDADGDGALSAEELSAGPNAERAFSRLDADGDGNVTLDEFKAAKRPAAQ